MKSCPLCGEPLRCHESQHRCIERPTDPQLWYKAQAVTTQKFFREETFQNTPCLVAEERYGTKYTGGPHLKKVFPEGWRLIPGRKCMVKSRFHEQPWYWTRYVKKAEFKDVIPESARKECFA